MYIIIIPHALTVTFINLFKCIIISYQTELAHDVVLDVYQFKLLIQNVLY